MQASDLVPSTFNNGFNLAGYNVKEVASLGPCLEKSWNVIFFLQKSVCNLAEFNHHMLLQKFIPSE